MARRVCFQRLKWVLLIGLVFLATSHDVARCVELAVLTEENWDELVPQGKEVDAIYGDYVLRNDKIVAVIARDVDGRNANMTVRNVGGCVIDLTRRGVQSDQLSAYYPVADRVLKQDGGGASQVGDDEPTVESWDTQQLRDLLSTKNRITGSSVFLQFQAQDVEGHPGVTVTYLLSDDEDYLDIISHYFNSKAEE